MDELRQEETPTQHKASQMQRELQEHIPSVLL